MKIRLYANTLAGHHDFRLYQFYTTYSDALKQESRESASMPIRQEGIMNSL